MGTDRWRVLGREDPAVRALPRARAWLAGGDLGAEMSVPTTRRSLRHPLVVAKERSGGGGMD